MKKLFAGLALAGYLAVPMLTRANVLQFQMTNTFSGTMPTGSAPWSDITLSDVSPGTVILTVTNVNITSSEKISELYLNINPAYDVTKLVFSNLGETSGVMAPLPRLQEDGFKADGDGKYDILFQFSQPPTGAFSMNDYVSYEITGIPTLQATDFEYLSTPAGGHGPFYAAMHVQGISSTSVTDGGASSGWISPGQGDITIIGVPEPSATALGLIGLALATGRIWLRRSPRS